MALTTTTTVYDAPAVPETTLTSVADSVSGLTLHTVSVDITGLLPTRNTTAEERAAGITSLFPPTVQSTDPQRLIELAQRACGSSYDATDGYEMTPDVSSFLVGAVSHGVMGALRNNGVDV